MREENKDSASVSASEWYSKALSKVLSNSENGHLWCKHEQVMNDLLPLFEKKHEAITSLLKIMETQLLECPVWYVLRKNTEI
jgi:hypothetical protein